MTTEGRKRPTLGDLLALVDLSNLLVEELVTLLADLDNLLSLHAKSYRYMLDNDVRQQKIIAQHTGNSVKDVVGNLRSGLVLGQGIRVVEGVI